MQVTKAPSVEFFVRIFFLILQKCMFNSLNHIRHLLPHLHVCCSNICQIWIWYSVGHRCFDNFEKLKQITEWKIFVSGLLQNKANSYSIMDFLLGSLFNYSWSCASVNHNYYSAPCQIFSGRMFWRWHMIWYISSLSYNDMHITDEIWGAKFSHFIGHSDVCSKPYTQANKQITIEAQHNCFICW